MTIIQNIEHLKFQYLDNSIFADSTWSTDDDD